MKLIHIIKTACSSMRLRIYRSAVIPMIVIAVLITVAGCATVSGKYPPIMGQDELRRSYVKLAVIEFSSHRFGNLEAITPDDYKWVHNELRERAYLLGADAVALPEIKIEHDTFFGLPWSQIRARGIALKFR